MARWLSLSLVLLIPLLVSPPTEAGATEIFALIEDDSGWTQEHLHESGTVVYGKEVPALGLTAYKGVKRVDPDVDVGILWWIINKVEDHDTFNSSLHESELIKREGAVADYYQVLKSPGMMLSERFWFNRATAKLNLGGEEGHNRRRWQPLDKGSYQETFNQVRARYPDAVLIDRTWGSWELDPSDDGGVDVIYRTVSHPGGNVPESVFAALSSKNLPNNILTFEKRARALSKK